MVDFWIYKDVFSPTYSQKAYFSKSIFKLLGKRAREESSPFFNVQACFCKYIVQFLPYLGNTKPTIHLYILTNVILLKTTYCGKHDIYNPANQDMDNSYQLLNLTMKVALVEKTIYKLGI